MDVIGFAEIALERLLPYGEQWIPLSQTLILQAEKLPHYLLCLYLRLLFTKVNALLIDE